MSNRFGGEWTVTKLECVKRYLDAYVKVMKNQHNFTTHYIDAFAGTGYVDLRKEQPNEPTLWEDLDEAQEGAALFLSGSAAQSLDVDPQFDNYHFIEKDPARAQELRRIELLRQDLEHRIQVVNGDANEELQRLCSIWPKKTHRGVVFLDPFAMQVNWDTLTALAGTRSLDVWYLVAVGALNRMLPTGSKPPEEWRDTLRRVFGTDDWEGHFYRPSPQPSLFGQLEADEDPDGQVERVRGLQHLREFVLARLRSAFDAVSLNPLVLRNSKGSPLFLLCFAMNSENPGAQRIALNIANHILEMV
jgi:three-Cys-motif partner protein